MMIDDDDNDNDSGTPRSAALSSSDALFHVCWFHSPWRVHRRDGDTIHRGVYRPSTERLTLHNSWSSLRPLPDGEQRQRNVCDSRFLHWTHPDTRNFLASIRGRCVPGVLERAWDNYMATKTVPPQVAAWNASHPAAELPAYNPTEAVDEAILGAKRAAL